MITYGTLLFLCFLSSLCGAVCGFFFFFLYCKHFKPSFYQQLILDKNRAKAPMQDRRAAESYHSKIEPSNKEFESFMSLAQSQSLGSSILFENNQEVYGNERTIDELCDEQMQKTTEEDVFRVMQDETVSIKPPDTQTPESVTSNNETNNDAKTEEAEFDDRQPLSSPTEETVSAPKMTVSPNAVNPQARTQSRYNKNTTKKRNH